MSQVFSLKAIAEHNEASKQPWIIIDGKVYDVTEFASSHPGGEEVVLELAGQDATEGFNNVGHSEDAKKQLAGLLIGVVDPAELAELATSSAVSGGGSSNLIKYIVTAAIVGAAVYMGLMTKKY